MQDASWPLLKVVIKHSESTYTDFQLLKPLSLKRLFLIRLGSIGILNETRIIYLVNVDIIVINCEGQDKF